MSKIISRKPHRRAVVKGGTSVRRRWCGRDTGNRPRCRDDQDRHSAAALGRPRSARGAGLSRRCPRDRRGQRGGRPAQPEDRGSADRRQRAIITISRGRLDARTSSSISSTTSAKVQRIRETISRPAASTTSWGVTDQPGQLWTVDEMRTIRRDIEDAGLTLAAIENLDPGIWYDILLDGPRRAEQIEHVKTTVRRMGEAGIPVLGYNFSIAGVCGRISGPFGRGGALTLGMDGSADEAPLHNGTVWNMVYDEDAAPGFLPSISHDELWRRLFHFLAELIPVAEQAGVRLALHPDDPPMPTMRQQPRLVYQPSMYQRLLNDRSSDSNALELCVGTLAEMTGTISTTRLTITAARERLRTSICAT